jgi:uncharacterized Zn finger protein
MRPRAAWSSLPCTGGRRHPGSTLAEILLDENEVDEAWEIASAHGCVERLYRALGGPEAFTAYVAEVRAEHRRKRNLMAPLDGRRWG